MFTDAAAPPRGLGHPLKVVVPLAASLLLHLSGCGLDKARLVEAVPSSSGQGDHRPLTAPSPDGTIPQNAPGLSNLVTYQEGFISGSVPEGAIGLDSLASLGVRTIISVDGASPEVEAARDRGMRYIHLPIGYDGFDEHRRRQLTRAVLDGLEDGVVYIHCHHGMHRSAGAAAAVMVGAGWASPDEAVGRMHVSGTSPRYRGLFLCATRSTPISEAEIESIDPNFPEVDRPDDFVDAMVRMDRALEHLELIADAGWRTPEDHPDLVPAAEAGRLADLLRIASQGNRAGREVDPDFGAWLARNAREVSALESLLLEPKIDRDALDRSMAAVQNSCVACHAKHRD
ncbi:MAG: hypothetical protein CMJ67_02170 [Planctomycetaceae bacterium]|nr:hypothetical protein [Planctomycetaceae bacterium]